jgi:hypothetical protein
MQIVDNNGNVFGSGLQVNGPDGKPKTTGGLTVWGSITGTLSAQTDLQTALNGKQDTLVSATNIKTINGSSILGSGDLTVGGSGLTVGTTAITSGTIGRVLFQGTGNVLQQSANLFWDNTNNRLGIGSSTPSNKLDVYGTITGASVDTIIRANGGADYVGIGINATKSGGTGQVNFFFQKNGTNVWQFGSDFAANGTKDFFIYDSTVGRNPFYVSSGGEVRIGSASTGGTGGYWNTAPLNVKTSGNVQIGSTTDAGFKLDVNGTARVQGNTNIIGFLSATNYLECRGSIFLRTSVGGGNTSFNTDASTMYIAQSSSVNLQIGYGGNYSFLLNNANRTIGIADNGSVPTLAASAVLTLSSTTKGFLPPRMTNAQMLAIATPAAGLVVYDTTNNKHCGYNGTAWQNFY